MRFNYDHNDDDVKDWIDIESRLKSHKKCLNLKELSLTTAAWFEDEEKNKAIQIDNNDNREHDWIDVKSLLKSHQNKTKFVNLKEMSLTMVAWFKYEEKIRQFKAWKNYFQTMCPKIGQANSQPPHCIKLLKKYGMGLDNVSLLFLLSSKHCKRKNIFLPFSSH